MSDTETLGGQAPGGTPLAPSSTTSSVTGCKLPSEAKVLADVNGTSGIQTLAYATSVLTTLRKGITKLEVAGYTSSAFVLHPSDWESVELALSSTNSIEHQGLPYDPATRRLFGVPVTTSLAQAAGVGHVLPTGAVALDTDTRAVDVQWSENATSESFGKNLVSAPASHGMPQAFLARSVWCRWT